VCEQPHGQHQHRAAHCPRGSGTFQAEIFSSVNWNALDLILQNSFTHAKFRYPDSCRVCTGSMKCFSLLAQREKFSSPRRVAVVYIHALLLLFNVLLDIKQIFSS